MKHLLFIAFIFLLNFSVYGQKKNFPRKVYSVKPQKVKPTPVLLCLYADYVFTKYQSVTKSKLKKKQIQNLKNTSFSLSKSGISSKNSVINNISFSIFQVEKMKPDDFLYRSFQTVTGINLIDVPEVFTVHKTNDLNLFGIIQLLNGQIVFPFKGGLIYAKRKGS